MQTDNIPVIVLSGGPCAGKTTALTRIVAWCQERGFHPLLVPEVATELISSGLDPKDTYFQYFVLEEIVRREKLRLKAATSGHYKKPVIICDRGRMDGQAYVERPAVFEEILRDLDLSYTTARDIYSGVIFLDSAACGAESFYTIKNNEARRENLVQARKLNENTKAAWNGTPHLIVIPNRSGESFDDKMWHCTQALARILGVPEPIECERKFKIESFNPALMPSDAVAINIAQTYLNATKPGAAERVRARGQKNSWLYFHTVKEPMGAGTVIEHERLISKAEYEALLTRRDRKRHPIVKQRHCFVYEHQYCELDVFDGHRTGLVMLEIELHKIDQPVTVPSFLGRYTDVTDRSEFSNHALARAA